MIIFQSHIINLHEKTINHLSFFYNLGVLKTRPRSYKLCFLIIAHRLYISLQEFPNWSQNFQVSRIPDPHFFPVLSQVIHVCLECECKVYCTAKRYKLEINWIFKPLPVLILCPVNYSFIYCLLAIDSVIFTLFNSILEDPEVLSGLVSQKHSFRNIGFRCSLIWHLCKIRRLYVERCGQGWYNGR